MGYLHTNVISILDTVILSSQILWDWCCTVGWVLSGLWNDHGTFIFRFNNYSPSDTLCHPKRSEFWAAPLGEPHILLYNLHDVWSFIGSYTDSPGIEIIRRHVAQYIERRDGIGSKWENIILSAGASDAIKVNCMSGTNLVTNTR
jgi:hypothetical protein